MNDITSELARKSGVAFRLGLWNLNRRLRSSLTFKSKQGVFELPLEIDDPISKLLYVKREFELSMIKETLSVIREITGAVKGRGTVLDLGANNGVISIGMLVSGEVDRAVCVEPDPRNFSRLQRNISLNCLDDKTICLNYAVSDTDSTLEFEISETNYGDHRVRRSSGEENHKEFFRESGRKLIRVPAKTLDALLADVRPEFRDEIAVVWVDVQGHDGYVFAAGGKLLSSGVPVVTEVWPYGILRAGMSCEKYCKIVAGLWSNYWVKRKRKYVKYPTAVFDTFFEELGTDGEYDNVILTK